MDGRSGANTMATEKGRHYPTCCQSMYCGDFGDTCNTCKNKPIKDEFEKWREETKAIQPDETWLPTYYIPTKQV